MVWRGDNEVLSELGRGMADEKVNCFDTIDISRAVSVFKGRDCKWGRDGRYASAWRKPPEI